MFNPRLSALTVDQLTAEERELLDGALEDSTRMDGEVATDIYGDPVGRFIVRPRLGGKRPDRWGIIIAPGEIYWESPK